MWEIIDHWMRKVVAQQDDLAELQKRKIVAQKCYLIYIILSTESKDDVRGHWMGKVVVQQDYVIDHWKGKVVAQKGYLIDH